jgi:hypothetical protein
VTRSLDIHATFAAAPADAGRTASPRAITIMCIMPPELRERMRAL